MGLTSLDFINDDLIIMFNNQEVFFGYLPESHIEKNPVKLF